MTYTVFVKRGKVGVSGRDEVDGTALEISQIKWNGDSLQFTSFYPPGQHEAKHVLRLLTKSKMSHEVSCTYADGEAFSDSELWVKRHVARRVSVHKT